MSGAGDSRLCWPGTLTIRRILGFAILAVPRAAALHPAPRAAVGQLLFPRGPEKVLERAKTLSKKEL